MAAGTPAGRVRVAAFALLLGKRCPLEPAEIATIAGVDDIERSLDDLAAAGWVDRDAAGRVTGAAGLSLNDGPHTLVIDGHHFRTWCAYDAVGIAGALNTDASIETRCGWCDSPITVAIRSGRPQSGSPARLWLSAGGSDLRAEFCEPTVLLCSVDHAERWSARHDGRGEILTLPAAADRGAIEWTACATAAVEYGSWEEPSR